MNGSNSSWCHTQHWPQTNELLTSPNVQSKHHLLKLAAENWNGQNKVVQSLIHVDEQTSAMISRIYIQITKKNLKKLAILNQILLGAFVYYVALGPNNR